LQQKTSKPTIKNEVAVQRYQKQAED